MYSEIRDANNNLIMYKENSTSKEIPINEKNMDYRER